jgi:hypothetical protein
MPQYWPSYAVASCYCLQAPRTLYPRSVVAEAIGYSADLASSAELLKCLSLPVHYDLLNHSDAGQEVFESHFP